MNTCWLYQETSSIMEIINYITVLIWIGTQNVIKSIDNLKLIGIFDGINELVLIQTSHTLDEHLNRYFNYQPNRAEYKTKQF